MNRHRSSEQLAPAPPPARPGRPRPQLSHDAPGWPDADTLAVLQMLASGATDETAARRLGMSVRSLRRRVAHLMRMLGASSRFEAGVRAAELGWVAATRRGSSGPSPLH